MGKLANARSKGKGRTEKEEKRRLIRMLLNMVRSAKGLPLLK